jgi:hypothetical protein
MAFAAGEMALVLTGVAANREIARGAVVAILLNIVKVYGRFSWLGLYREVVDVLGWREEERSFDMTTSGGELVEDVRS